MELLGQTYNWKNSFSKGKIKKDISISSSPSKNNLNIFQILEFYYHVETLADLVRAIFNDFLISVFTCSGSGLIFSLIKGLYFRIFLNYKLPAFIGKSFRIINKWNIKIGNSLWVRDNVTLFTGGPLEIGNSCCLAERSTIWSGKKGVYIGDNFFLGIGSYISAIVGKVTIGNDVMVADNVSFYTWNHRFEKNNKPYRKLGGVIKDIKIGDNCWLGTGVKILAGVNLGNNCVVAAGTILTGKKYPNNSLIAGSPGKIIKKI